MPHSQPIALQQTVCKFHLDPQYHIFHWGSTILGDSMLWGIVEDQISSIKVLFKTNTKGHKHPSIRLLSKSKTQLVNQRKQKVAFRPGTAYSPEIQSYRTWWGAAWPILNDTPVVYLHRFRCLFLDLLWMGWRGCASAMGAIKLPPSCSSPKIMCQSINII